MIASKALIVLAGVVLCYAGVARAGEQAAGCDKLRIYAPTTGAYSASTNNGNGMMAMNGQLILENLSKSPLALKSIAVSMAVPGQAKPTVVPAKCQAGASSTTKVACAYTLRVPVQAGASGNEPVAVVQGMATTPSGATCRGAPTKLMSASAASAAIQAQTQQYVQAVMGDVNSYVNNMLGGMLG